MRHFLFVLLALCTGIACRAADVQVGPAAGGGYVVATRQLVRPAGSSVEFSGRPVDLALSPDGKSVYVKTDRSLIVVDAKAWKINQNLDLNPSGKGSYHGMAATRDGSKLYVTTSAGDVLEGLVDAKGTVSLVRGIHTPGPEAKGSSVPCGIALSPDEKLAYVCLSRDNSLAVLDIASGNVQKQIPVGVAPYDVVISPDGETAWVSNWGGRRAKEPHPSPLLGGEGEPHTGGEPHPNPLLGGEGEPHTGGEPHPNPLLGGEGEPHTGGEPHPSPLLGGEGERTENSSGTATLVDERSVACSGTVSLVDLVQGKKIAQVETGLHPCDLALDAVRGLLYVANANSDSVSVIGTRTKRVVRTIDVKPDVSLPFGSAPNALALDSDGKRLYVANGGNNAIAVVEAKTLGFIPTAWYPGAVATDGKYLYIANVKGYGSRDRKTKPFWQINMPLGTVQKVQIPDRATLVAYTSQVRADARIPQVLRAREKAQSGVKPAPVPEHAGEPSSIEHVVYIIKENKTYDQVLGDMPKGNGDPKLCSLGKEITPNHHALADQFVLLDNYYCNCSLSADGHQWVTQGYATDYLEKAFGGFPRSYPYEGNDPLAYSSAGFIWDHVLLHGLSFRNYGEMSSAVAGPKASFKEILEDSRQKTGKFRFTGRFNIETLRNYSCPDFPGWTLGVPDQTRADVFLKELAEAEKKGEWPDFMTILLPNDHTAGLSPGQPSPRAFVADNDLALGRIVEGISKSRFWAKTAIFVIEDDPQSGYDHVDGHRSLCLVASPYVKRGAVVSNFYNQTSVLHTMELILGIPPMNQMDAMAPAMRECFVAKPDLTPYAALPSNVPLDEMNPEKAKLSGKALDWAEKSMAMRFDELDMADEDTLNRTIWHAMKGFDTPYPVAFASVDRD